MIVTRSHEISGVDVIFGSRKSLLGEWHPLSCRLSGGTAIPPPSLKCRGPAQGTRDSVSGAEAGSAGSVVQGKVGGWAQAAVLQGTRSSASQTCALGKFLLLLEPQFLTYPAGVSLSR